MLCCALGEQLVRAALPTWSFARDSINTAGVTKLVAALPRLANLARNLYPVLCVADTDGNCVRHLLSKWLPVSPPSTFALRLAVNEAESWLLGDRKAIAKFLDIPLAKIPSQPETLSDPKTVLLQLARRSRSRTLRSEMINRDGTKPGAGYVLHLSEFARTSWSAARAAEGCPSLRRAMQNLQAWR